MKNKIIFTLLSILLISISPKEEMNFHAKCIGVKDGDTYVVLFKDMPVTIRLAHVDCPENGQAFGKNAKKFGSDFCFGKEVYVKSDGTVDRYGRIIAEIYVGEKCLNKELVNHGFAWHFKKYSTSEEYSDLEIQAASKKVGLWKDESPTPPWDYRKEKKKKSWF